ncbi:AraC family transcriptional regulator [Verticiella sediminum]|uniref:AraC family transcriptional regulator n=1 Tax=Verticiella sediminum TaxID=1247510 RepID=A0A556ADW0_9BURK|nr:AraC family transcriptional regulator [Verticiella sediminum]TSH91066.1 AraC family transcriptional regulator [Verticiella sediminum]
MEKGSVAIVFVHAALSGLAPQPQAVSAALAAAGIAPESLQAAGARVSADQYGRLWRAVALALDDEFFGQDARRMKCGSFALMCQAAIGARTLGGAAARIARFFGIVLDDFAVVLREHGALARLELHARHAGAARPFAHETLLIMLHGVLCWLAGRRIALREAGFAYAEPAYSAEYRVMYCGVLRFGVPQTYVVFDAAVLALPVQRTRADLRRFLRSAPANFIVKYQNPEGWAARVRRQLKRTPPTAWPAFDTLAASFGVSVSTLRRRLEQEGQSYRAIREQLRRDLALAWLADTRRSVTRIALELGFADPSAFRRAFRGWTGARPGEYRRAPGGRRLRP